MSRPEDQKVPVKEGDVLASKYRVEKVLGAGGMGIVVAATQLEIDRKVALKFLLPGLAESDELINRFMREAKASVRLKGKHIAQVLDVGRMDNGAPYIVMEHLDGRDLGDELKVAPNPLPIELAASWVIQACEGLAEAHALGIVHRDIKPGNIFLTNGLDGRPCVKVLDFGISKTIDPMVKEGLSSLTKTEMLLGSPLYMAPEQMRSSKHVDERSDIWGLGAILYELLTRKVPFVADTLLELCFKVAQESPPDVRKLREDIPEDLAKVVMRCLEKDPTKRWMDVGELATALEPFANAKDRGTAERTAAILGASMRPPRPATPSDPKPSDPNPSDPTPTLAESPSARKLVGDDSGTTPAPEASTPENAAAWGTTQAERLEKKKKSGLVLAGVAIVAAAAIAGVMLGRSSSSPSAGLVPPPPPTPQAAVSTAMPSATATDPPMPPPIESAAPVETTSAAPSAKATTTAIVARPRPTTPPKASATASAPKPPASVPSDPGFIKVRE